MKGERTSPEPDPLLAEPAWLGHQIDNVIDPSFDPCWPFRPIRLMAASGLSFYFASILSLAPLACGVQTKIVTQSSLTSEVSNPSEFVRIGIPVTDVLSLTLTFCSFMLAFMMQQHKADCCPPHNLGANFSTFFFNFLKKSLVLCKINKMHSDLVVHINHKNCRITIFCFSCTDVNQCVSAGRISINQLNSKIVGMGVSARAYWEVAAILIWSSVWSLYRVFNYLMQW